MFFFHVGIELKYEFMHGGLNNAKTARLPLFGAIGGVVVPAIIYVLFNFGDLLAYRGWAIPAATDIAFAVGFISMLGKRVPPILYAFLLAIAIFDDICAIAIIALFYTKSLQVGMLLLASATIAGLVLFKRASVSMLAPYLWLGALLWFFVLQSGLHATLAGVLVAFFIPSEYPKKLNKKPGERLLDIEQALYGYVYYLILPIFAFANTGISLGELSPDMWLNPITLGVGLGLLIGKPLGIMFLIWLSVRMQFASLPKGLTLRYVFGISLLCGIGFTMSLFISDLAFDSDLVTEKAYALGAKLGILFGSMFSCILGMSWLYLESRMPYRR